MHECQVRLLDDNQAKYGHSRSDGWLTSVVLILTSQSRGVSPSCIKHLRLLKQFLMSLSAVKRGAAPLGAGLYPLPTTAKVKTVPEGRFLPP